MTKISLSRADLADLAKVERYLILSILAGVACGGLALAANSEAALNAVIVLRSLIGLVSFFFYFFLLKLARVEPVWLYIVLAIAFVFYVPQLPLMMIFHIVKVNRDIFRPRGIGVGLLGPKL